MTTKDFVLIAEVLRSEYQAATTVQRMLAIERLTVALAVKFRNHYSRFDYDKFVDACI